MKIYSLHPHKSALISALILSALLVTGAGIFIYAYSSNSKPDSQTPTTLQLNQAKAADLTTSFSETNSTTEVKVKNKEYQISFSAQNSDQTRYSRLPNGVKEEIILAKAPTAPFIAKYTATLSGVKPRFLKNLWRFFDEGGKEQFFIPKPFMIDQKGQKSESINLQISPISASQYQITLTPDYSWLTSPDRTYPVIVDPTIEIPNQPIQEIISKRNQNSKTYSLPNGRFAWEGQTGPIHYKDNPNNPEEPWKEIDTTVQPVADPISSYDFQNVTNSFKSFFKKNSYDPDTVRYEGSGSYITFTNQDNELGTLRSVEGYTQDNQFIYPDAYDNIDIKYSIGTSVLLEEFVLKGPRDVSKISQRVHFEDAEYRQQQDGSINFYSTKTNELVWSFPKPKMYELNEREDENFGLHYEITKEGDDYIVTKVLDQEGKDWLNSPKRVYPLVIDATIDKQVGASADDGSVTPDTSGYNNSGTTARLGLDWRDDQHTWARFTSVTIPSGAIIDVAYYSIYPTTSPELIETKLSADDQVNPTAPTSAADYTGRTKTTAQIDWDGTFSGGSFNDSPSIVSIIQELVNSYDYSAGSTMQILHGNDKPEPDTRYVDLRTYDFSGNTSGPKLHIEYTLPTMQLNGLKMQGIKVK